MITEKMIEAHARADAAFAERDFDGMAAADKTRFRERSKVCLTAALSTVPSAGAEAVAWRWKFDEDAEWHYGNRKPTGFRFGDPDIIEPLYPSPSAPEAQVRVKALEWDDKLGLSTAMTTFAFHYSVWEVDDERWECNLLDGAWKTKHMAKSAAQSDYEARVRAALSTPEQGETAPSPETQTRVTDRMVIAAGDVLLGHVNAPEQAIYRAARLALEAALATTESKQPHSKCAICEGTHDNDVLTDICTSCEARINEEGSP
jgi:hypothetical protein